MITPWAGFTEILFNLAEHIKHTIMKHLFLFYTIIVILFLGCSKDENQDFDEFSKDSGTFIDERDGHEYKWVKIGEQIWMAENLAYLPEVYPLRFQSYTDPYYFVLYYDGNDAEEAKDTENYKNYGVLYNWTAACIVCPEGWHLPSFNEWENLAQYISDQKGPFNHIKPYSMSLREDGKISVNF